MAYDESDDESSIQIKIGKLERELYRINANSYDDSMLRKFLNHSIADLKYKLKEQE